MKNIFVDKIEAFAKFQYTSEDFIKKIDKYMIQVNQINGISDQDKKRLLSLLNEIKPLILQELALKDGRIK